MIKVSETEMIISSTRQAKRTSLPSSMAPATRLVRYPGQKVSILQKVVAKSCGRINFDAGRLCTSTYLPKVNGAAIRTCRSEKATTDLSIPALAKKLDISSPPNGNFYCEAIRMLALRRNHLLCRRASMQSENPAI